MNSKKKKKTIKHDDFVCKKLSFRKRQNNEIRDSVLVLHRVSSTRYLYTTFLLNMG